MAEPTRYLESNALLAVQNGDEEAAHAALQLMLPNERRTLRRACYDLIGLLDSFDQEDP